MNGPLTMPKPVPLGPEAGAAAPRGVWLDRRAFLVGGGLVAAGLLARPLARSLFGAGSGSWTRLSPHLHAGQFAQLLPLARNHHFLGTNVLTYSHRMHQNLVPSKTGQPKPACRSRDLDGPGTTTASCLTSLLLPSALSSRLRCACGPLLTCCAACSRSRRVYWLIQEDDRGASRHCPGHPLLPTQQLLYLACRADP